MIPKPKFKTISLLSENSPSPKKDGKQDSQMEEYKEQIIRWLLIEHINSIKTEDDQKTIALEGDIADKLISYLEQHDLTLRYCRLCDIIIPDSTTTE